MLGEVKLGGAIETILRGEELVSNRMAIFAALSII